MKLKIFHMDNNFKKKTDQCKRLRVEDSSENILVKEEPKFLIVNEIEEGTLKKLSPFIVAKIINGLVGEVASVKRLRSGSLLIETKSNKQSKKLLEATSFHNVPVKVEPHRSLNTCEGVITSRDLAYCSIEDLIEGFGDQKVIAARRLKTKRSGVLQDTFSIILTFSSPNLPAFVYAGYEKLSVRPFIPRPMRCFRCQKYGHSSSSCKGEEVCGRCSLPKHEGECAQKETCVNCKSDHPSWSSSCPVFIEERGIQEIKVTKRLPYGEAKKAYRAFHPTLRGPSYASVASKAIETKEAAVQTHLPSVCGPCKGVFISPNLQTQKQKEMFGKVSQKSKSTKTSERKAMEIDDTSDSESSLWNTLPTKNTGAHFKHSTVTPERKTHPSRKVSSTCEEEMEELSESEIQKVLLARKKGKKCTGKIKIKR